MPSFRLLPAVVALALGTACFAQTDPTASSAPATLPIAKTMIDYFLPTPITSPLTREAWGADNVLPRDAGNGLESREKTVNYTGKAIEARL